MAGSGGGQDHDLQLHRPPAGCAQSCGTRTFPHLAASPSTVQAVSVVLGRDDGEAEGGGLVPEQPAAVSATAARARSTTPGGGADTVAEALPVELPARHGDHFPPRPQRAAS